LQEVTSRSNADSSAVSQIKARKKKNVKKGIQFSLMVCGQSGTGELEALDRTSLSLAENYN